MSERRTDEELEHYIQSALDYGVRTTEDRMLRAMAYILLEMLREVRDGKTPSAQHGS